MLAARATTRDKHRWSNGQDIYQLEIVRRVTYRVSRRCDTSGLLNKSLGRMLFGANAKY